MMSANGTQMPVITSDKRELRRCTLHLWPNYNGLGLILKYSTQLPAASGSQAPKVLPHIIKQVEVDSPAFYAGVLANDYIIKVGQRNAEAEKFDTVLKWIKEQLKKEKKCELLLLNSAYYDEFRRKYENSAGKVDWNSPSVQSQVKYYQSPLFNPNVGGRQYATTSSTTNLDQPPELRLCHLLTWSNYDGYGFYTAYNADGCFIRNVEPNSPAQLGGLRDYDRVIEINGKQVNAKDRDFVVKQINKHKSSQGGGSSGKSTLKSQSAYSIGGGSGGTTKSAKSVSAASSQSSSNSNYLNLLVADPITYKWYAQRKIDLSSKNKTLKVKEISTPAENSIGQLMTGTQQQQQQQLPQQPDRQTQNGVDTIRTNQSGVNTISRAATEIPRDVIMKKCIIRKLKGKENEPLGFEMTKLGNNPNYVSRVEPGSAAALSSLCVDDYLIELGHDNRNIEELDNDRLKQAIYQHLEPKNGGEIAFTTLNKVGYEYCVQNGIKPGNFVQINRPLILTYETPRELSTHTQPQPPVQSPPPPAVTSTPSSSILLPPATSTAKTTTAMISTATQVSRENKSTSTEDIRRQQLLQQELPRVCILRKSNEYDELGFSIARIKDLKEHVINDVVPGSLADHAGLRPNDCLLEVNGENVENRTHIETVKKISELKQLKNVDINLLVVQKPDINIQSSLASSKLNKASSASTPDLYLGGGSGSVSPSTGIVTVVNNNLGATTSTTPPSMTSSSALKSQSTKRVDLAGLGPATTSVAPPLPAGPRSINSYPEIKVCEFIGYPRGTQLGLVVTSDEYSHDIVKVADDSPAARCGIVKGDVVIAVNDLNVEGQPSSIELLNDFDELRPLKIVVASRYAYEWSKLLKIRITERDWPNVKKTTTRHVMTSTTTTLTTTKQQQQQQTVNNYYEPANITNTNTNSNTLTSTAARQLPLYTTTTVAASNQQFNRAASANASYNDLNGGLQIYQPQQSQQPQQQPIVSSTTPRRSITNAYVNGYSTTTNSRPATTDYWTTRSSRRPEQHHVGTLGRSAVDITADGRVLRLCTLVLNPNSPNITDSEFGFDLVTKIAGGVGTSASAVTAARISDYYIDTIDDNSPASRSGLRPGDRLVEVDGIDVTVRTFEEVVQLINEAKSRCRLKLLVYPSAILNYGNPDVVRQSQSYYQPQYQQQYQQQQQQPTYYQQTNIQTVDSRSMPDLSLQQPQVQPYNYATNSNYCCQQPTQLQPQYNNGTSSKTLYKQKRHHVVHTTKYPTNQVPNDYDSIYLKRQNQQQQQQQQNGVITNLNPQLSKSSSNLYNGFNSAGGTTTTTTSTGSSSGGSSYPLESSLRPVPRLCTIYKSDHSSNIGFGITTKPHALAYSTIIPPQYMRVTIVNYRSPAYISGLEAGDIIIEVNGRSTLEMSPDDTLTFIKTSYEVNAFVKLLVVSEFCYQWLYENDLLETLHTSHRSVFSYADYLKHNHRFVPRLCKIKLFPFSKSFGFSVDSILLTPPSVSSSSSRQQQLKSNQPASYAHMIMRVERDSPAHTSSLLKADRIIECDGVNVEHENEQQITERIYQAFVGQKQITLFVVDPDTDNFFKAKCIKLHSSLPIVQSITNSTDI